jgi:hypothetical protein
MMEIYGKRGNEKNECFISVYVVTINALICLIETAMCLPVNF